MKKITALLTVLALVLGLSACAKSTATWQEQYDLAIRYLSEGRYEEAIIAFQAAIEIDPKRADAYLGLADAYEAMDDAEQARQVLADALAVVADTDTIRSRLDGSDGSTALEPTPGTTVGPTREPAPELESTTSPEPTPTSVTTSEPTFTPEPAPEPTPGPTHSSTIIASGDCDENLTWTLNNDGLLTISGMGPMANCRYLQDGVMVMSSAPWYEDCSSITKVVIEDGVTSVGDGAFLCCWNLASVTIPNSITSIGEDAFFGCILTSVTIPDGVISIGDSAFADCGLLTSVTIPASVTTVGRAAFADSSSLNNVYYGGSEAQWNQIAIGEFNDPLLNTAIHYNS